MSEKGRADKGKRDMSQCTELADTKHRQFFAFCLLVFSLVCFGVESPFLMQLLQGTFPWHVRRQVKEPRTLQLICRSETAASGAVAAFCLHTGA